MNIDSIFICRVWHLPLLSYASEQALRLLRCLNVYLWLQIPAALLKHTAVLNIWFVCV